MDVDSEVPVKVTDTVNTMIATIISAFDNERSNEATIPPPSNMSDSSQSPSV